MEVLEEVRQNFHVWVTRVTVVCCSLAGLSSAKSIDASCASNSLFRRFQPIMKCAVLLLITTQT